MQNEDIDIECATMNALDSLLNAQEQSPTATTLQNIINCSASAPHPTVWSAAAANDREVAAAIPISISTHGIPAMLEDAELFARALALDDTNTIGHEQEDGSPQGILCASDEDEASSSTPTDPSLQNDQSADTLPPWTAPPPQTWSALAAEQQQPSTIFPPHPININIPVPSATRASKRGTKDPPTEEEQKRIRRVKNRASVEKCRHKQRMRLESLTQERTALGHENVLLRNSADEVRTVMQIILEQVASLSGVECEVSLS